VKNKGRGVQIFILRLEKEGIEYLTEYLTEYLSEYLKQGQSGFCVGEDMSLSGAFGTPMLERAPGNWRARKGK